jgi:threonine/homoserine/homoserine lactone efflux protein
MLMTLLVFMLYGARGGDARLRLTRPRVLQGLRACFAAGFVGLGIKLILAQKVALLPTTRRSPRANGD